LNSEFVATPFILDVPPSTEDQSELDELELPKDPTSPAVIPCLKSNEPEDPSVETGAFVPLVDEHMQCGEK
jgi:hypothetical protein